MAQNHMVQNHRIQLLIGESTAEIRLAQQPDTVKCWQLSKEPLQKGIQLWSQQHNISGPIQVQVACDSGHIILQKKLGQPPALVTTQGFSDWLEVFTPLKMPDEAKSPMQFLDKDLIFDISERTLQDGQVDNPLSLEDLDFLGTKFKLHSIQNVVLAFLHAHKNPQHEMRAAEVLQTQGYKVFPSSQTSDHPEEIARWWQAILSAYLFPFLEEQHQEITLGFKDCEITQIEYASPHGLKTLTPSTCASIALHGKVASLHALAVQRKTNLAFFDLEKFIYVSDSKELQSTWHVDGIPVALEHPPYRFLSLQPTQALAQGFWGAASFQKRELGLNPGPMCLGKGVQPGLLDILYLTGDLETCDFYNKICVERSKGRILENLMAFSKDSDSATPDSLNPLIQQVALRIYLDLNVNDKNPVLLAGPMLPAISNVLIREKFDSPHLEQSPHLSIFDGLSLLNNKGFQQ